MFSYTTYAETLHVNNNQRVFNNYVFDLFIHVIN